MARAPRLFRWLILSLFGCLILGGLCQACSLTLETIRYRCQRGYERAADGGCVRNASHADGSTDGNATADGFVSWDVAPDVTADGDEPSDAADVTSPDGSDDGWLADAADASDASDGADVRADVPYDRPSDAPIDMPFMCRSDRVCIEFRNEPGHEPVASFFFQWVIPGPMEVPTPWENTHCVGTIRTADPDVTRCVLDLSPIPSMTIIRFYPASAGDISVCGSLGCPGVPGWYTAWVRGSALPSAAIGQNRYPSRMGGPLDRWAVTFTTP